MDTIIFQIAFSFVISLVASQSMPDTLQGFLNPAHLLSKPEKDVMKSLNDVGFGNDVVEEPAKKLLLHLYDQLQRGESFQDTVSKRGKKQLKAADTIRSLASQGSLETICFHL